MTDTSDSSTVPPQYVLGPLQRLDAGRPWWQRWAFGFLFAYLVLYNLPFPLQHLPWLGDGEWLAPLGKAVQRYMQLKNDAVSWFGTKVLRLDAVANVPSGSGDTLFDYVQAATFASAALLFGVVFTLVDWRGRTIGFLHAMLRIHLRYALATWLLGYGFHKVFPLQFGELDGGQLYGTYGNASPMNLLWTFLSASSAYTIFGGVMEVLGGALLLFRSTTTLGALVSIVVLTNVAMLNYCYDVPVKLFSSHLVLMAVVLAAGDGRRLLAVLLTNRATQPVRLRRPMPVWLLVPILLLKAAFVGWLLWGSVSGNYTTWSTRGASPPPLRGIWEATEFSLVAADGTPAAPRAHWHHLHIDRYRAQDPTYVTVALLGYEKQSGTITVDTEKHTLHIEFFGKEAGAPLDLTYEERGTAATGQAPTTRQLVLTGQVQGGTLRAVLQKREPESFPIHSRGYRWIQPYPFNNNK